jgi:hypothetical protein
MSTIILKDDYKIINNSAKNQYIFKILFNLYSEDLIKSITKTKIILGATTTEKYDTLILNATSIKTFSEFHKHQANINGTRRLPTSIISKILYDLSTQLKYLISYKNKCFLGYSIENIIVIDNNKFVYLTNEYLKDIDTHNNKETIMVTSPFTSKDFFISPELLEIRVLPSYIHYKTSYFSLGQQIVNLFSEDDNEITTIENIHIKGTKLYYLLERMLEKDPTNRSIIFI